MMYVSANQSEKAVLPQLASLHLGGAAFSASGGGGGGAVLAGVAGAVDEVWVWSRAVEAGKYVRINRSTYQAKPFYLSSETVLPIK
jgi:outer membrane lipoprotein SlyB